MVMSTNVSLSPDNGVSIDGSVTVRELQPYYRPADHVVCEFNEQFNTSEDLETLSVRISGNTLKVNQLYDVIITEIRNGTIIGFNKYCSFW